MRDRVNASRKLVAGENVSSAMSERTSQSASFDAIVVGSGLGGLTAGALYARTGTRVLLLERNKSFGGAATTYHRGALTVEASLHETTHPDAPGDPKHAVFAALGLEDDIELVPVGSFQEVRCPLIGSPFVLPHGLDAVGKALSSRFPDNARAIRNFLRQVERTLRLGEFGEHDLVWRLAHAGELPLDAWALIRDIGASLSDVFERYFGANEAIKFALCPNLPYYADDPENFWWLGYAMAQSGYLRGGGYYIKGGSQVLSDRLAGIIREEGGQTLTGAEATGILIGPDGSAAGVRYRTGDGAEDIAQAPVIFANAAPHVVTGMLPADRREDFLAPFKDRKPSISLISATLGLNRKPSELGLTSYSTMLIPDWMKRFADYRDSAALFAEMPGERMPAACVVDYDRIDSGLAMDGVYPVNIVCPDRFTNWAGLDDPAYHARKGAWLDALIARLESEWPGFASAVVEKTMATARTLHDYLNTPEGAVYGFALEPPKGAPKGPPLNVQTSVDGLWLASAFAGFGGFTGAMGAGAAAARAALKHRKSAVGSSIDH
ncbi:MAG TPA: NAD(P)/FAD-dependent oxidoreductase [Hyphomonas sp.]|nr:NAD(P)/FAD-dependent oxidoreductase [Hyphomonas sp.]